MIRWDLWDDDLTDDSDDDDAFDYGAITDQE